MGYIQTLKPEQSEKNVFFQVCVVFHSLQRCYQLLTKQLFSFGYPKSIELWD